MQKWGHSKWEKTLFEQTVAEKTAHNSPHPSTNACILNEYAWLWVKRDGSTTKLTRGVYDLLAPGISNIERIELSGYLIAGETEYFRAHRNYAGVLHFPYITGSYGSATTGGIFSNIENLKIHPSYENYLKESFKPLGLYINFWHDTIQGKENTIDVVMINDYPKAVNGSLVLQFISENEEVNYTGELPFNLPR
ncbi:MAG: hypothetical protein HC906_19570 [Bacteroidales bacterium]|nr:hypothetical protein [Bacteroidales bacterium]